MDASTNTPRPANSRARDNFLADAVHPRTKRLSFGDGFRFGIGLITAQLLVALIVAGITWAMIVAFHLQ